MQHVFRVGGVAGDPVGRPKDQAVVGGEDPLQIVGARGYGFLLSKTRITERGGSVFLVRIEDPAASCALSQCELQLRLLFRSSCT